MRRFFAFGCSYTYYCYPTWADIVGSEFDEYYNQALFGAGNEFIQQMVYEVDFLKKLNSTDTVVVLLTSATRYDSFIDQTWQWRGSVFSETYKEVYTPKWHQELWSVEQGIISTWRAMKSIKVLLDQRGVNYKIITAFPILGDDWGGDISKDIKSADVLAMAQDFNANVDNRMDKTLFQQLQSKHDRPDLFYKFNFGMDGHPTVPMHLDFVKNELPDLYHPDMDNRAKMWHAGVHQNVPHKVNWDSPYFKKSRGQRIGTVANMTMG